MRSLAKNVRGSEDWRFDGQKEAASLSDVVVACCQMRIYREAFVEIRFALDYVRVATPIDAIVMLLSRQLLFQNPSENQGDSGREDAYLPHLPADNGE